MKFIQCEPDNLDQPERHLLGRPLWGWAISGTWGSTLLCALNPHCPLVQCVSKRVLSIKRARNRSWHIAWLTVLWWGPGGFTPLPYWTLVPSGVKVRLIGFLTRRSVPGFPRLNVSLPCSSELRFRGCPSFFNPVTPRKG